MAQNSETDKIKNLLLETSRIFQDAAKECIDSFFQRKSIIHDPWSVCDRLEGKFDHIASIGCSNNAFQAIVTVNINGDSLSEFLGMEYSIEEIPDIFGEFCNIYCGLILDQKPIKDTFGILLHALPLYSVNHTFFPKAPGLHGRVYCGDAWMYIGCVIKANAGIMI
jgi:hypothetical protein